MCIYFIGCQFRFRFNEVGFIPGELFYKYKAVKLPSELALNGDDFKIVTSML